VETMAMWERVDLLLLSRKEVPKTKTPMRTGMSTVETMKALVVTRSRYSRRAMSQTLCMDDVSGWILGGLVGDRFDEDLFEGGGGELEAGDTGVSDGGGEELLGVGAVAEGDLGVAAVVLRGEDGWVLEEGVVAGEGDLNGSWI
jgi:hypothetical protein